MVLIDDAPAPADEEAQVETAEERWMRARDDWLFGRRVNLARRMVSLLSLCGWLVRALFIRRALFAFIKGGDCIVLIVLAYFIVPVL